MPLDEAVLDEMLAELEKLRSWSPRVVSKLETFLRTDDEWALFRANPFTFAAERGVNEDEAVDLFLHASKVGVFQMSWILICPGCGGAVQSFSTLRKLCTMFHCFICSTDIETELDRFVQVSFTVSPKVRTIAAHDPQSLSVEDYYYRYTFTPEAHTPEGPRFRDMARELTKAITYIEPRAVAKLEFDVEPGAMVLYDAVTNAVFVYLVGPDAQGETPVQKLKLSAGVAAVPSTITVGPGRLRLEIENDFDHRSTALAFHKSQKLLDEAAAYLASGKPATLDFEKFLTGRRLLTSATFRQAFGTETIQSAEGIGVRDISILFTDLKGSTDLYDRIGDLKAFALVNQHFDRLARAVHRNRGAVVKTIGDAVMASFERPVDAVHAARDMLREIEAFNREVGEREIVLKIGVHRGAAIAVTLNDRLDFFGQSVNIASRVQGLADADEIYVTDDVYNSPGVTELLSEYRVTPKQATLKGVQRAVNVYQVTNAPQS
jgi:class 3 adenylate cyclase